jgi:ribonucleoside-diphosphate reductase alpha chain
MTRRRLPARRKCVTVAARVAGFRVYVSTGEYPDGTVGELFVTVAKVGSPLRTMIEEWSVTFSIALQHGTPLRTLVAAALGRQGEPRGMVEGGGPIRECTSLTDYVVQVLGGLYPGEAGQA